MFRHVKKLQYTVRVSEPNPGLANLLLEQFGGPQGELAAAMRYFTQGLGDDDLGRRDMLMDIATEELSHLEIIGSLVGMLNKGAKGKLAEGTEAEGELYRSITGAGNDSHLTSILYGGGAPPAHTKGGRPATDKLRWRAMDRSVYRYYWRSDGGFALQYRRGVTR